MKRDIPIPHDSAIPIPDALSRAMSRCAGSAKQDTTLTIGDFSFRLKPHATTIKVYSGSKDYYGKIEGGRFFAATSLDVVTISEILHILQSPKQAAIDHGRTTGCCAICGIMLTDPASLLIGIGPICLGKWSWDDDAFSLEDLA